MAKAPYLITPKADTDSCNSAPDKTVSPLQKNTGERTNSTKMAPSPKAETPKILQQ